MDWTLLPVRGELPAGIDRLRAEALASGFNALERLAADWADGSQRFDGPGELFLLSPGKPDAFDGRYFGVTVPGEILGRARLLWAA